MHRIDLSLPILHDGWLLRQPLLRSINLVDIDKLIILEIGQIKKSILTQSLAGLVGDVFVGHGGVDQFSRLVVCDSLVFSLLVEEDQDHNLSTDHGQKGTEHGHDSFESRNVMWSVLRVEQEGANNVSDCGSGM